MGSNNVLKSLDLVIQRANKIDLTKKDKYVIFSDLHMGEGNGKDDFVPNSSLFLHAIKDYYFEKDYFLILNGDVEELQRYDINQIYNRWKKVYKVFDQYATDERLLKIIGNHDIILSQDNNLHSPYPVFESVMLDYKENPILIFHGHQASNKYNLQNALIGYTLRYIANPLGIKNYSVSHSSRKKYKIEKNVYEFSRQKKMLSIIGHTHRPLFESLPKPERIKYRIEQLMREYSSKELTEESRIGKLIGSYKNELSKIYGKNMYESNANLYDSMIHVPCLFNSGCVIGKRGMTCLEIVNGKIRLVHWFDKRISKKYLHHTGYEPQQMEETDFFRMMINKEKLNYIFARINLLA